MLATLNTASVPTARRGRSVAEDAALMLDALVLLTKGEAEAAAVRLNELGRSGNLLKITALLCADEQTKGDLGLRRARRRFLSVVGAQGAVTPSAVADAQSQSDAIVSVAEPGTVSLTKKQIAVLICVREGLTNSMIAAELCVSINTIKWYIREMSRMLGARNRCSLVHRAQLRGLI